MDLPAADFVTGPRMLSHTGNDGLNDDEGEDVPSDFGYDIILPVAASTTADEVAMFSNYGRHSVLLAAPGTSIISTVPNARYFVYAVRTSDLTSPPCLMISSKQCSRADYASHAQLVFVVGT